MPVLLDLSGCRFERLLVLGRAPKIIVKKDSASAYNRWPSTRWFCRCDCGKEITADTDKLRSGNTKSCGCLQREKAGNRVRRHGLSHTPEWRVWRSMRERCHIRPHARYGGRGISVCERWRGERDFPNFIADMGFRPTPKHSLERIDNDGPYSPENCKWATRLEQANNTCASRRLTLNGQTKTLAQWGRFLGVNPSSIANRLYHGWSHERALSQPFRVRSAQQ